MQSKDSKFPARPEPARQRLTSPWTLLGITVVIAVTLVLIFPGRGVVMKTSKQQHPDQVGLSYLHNLVRQDPKNHELRFTLAQKQVDLGQIAEGRAALEPLYNSPDPAVRQRARLLDFKLQMEQMQAMQPGSRERQRETERLRQELAAMSQYEWNVAGLLDLANFATRLESRKLRADIYLRIARSDNKVARQWIEEAARTVLGDSEYDTAAEIYFTAQERAQSLEDQRHYFISGVKALQSGNKLREAVAAADRHVGALANDDQILVFLIHLARAANDMPRAQAYTKKLMRMSEQGALVRWVRTLASVLIPSAAAANVEPTNAKPSGSMRPYDPENYRLAYDVFVASSNLNDAYRVASAAVQAVPNDMGWRERLAHVSEWSNRPEEALQQWIYIARRTGRPAAWQAVLRLAPGLFDDQALLEALQWQTAKGGRLSDAQWRAIVEAYERVGRPREGVAFLEREYTRRPQPILLELQAYLLERMGDLDGAIAANRRVIERSGATTPRVANLATLLLARGDYKAAFDLLESHRGKVAKEDSEYWKLLADIAWELQQDTNARQALGTLVETGKATPEDFSRLISLLYGTQPEMAARLAELGYERFKTSDFLVSALTNYSDRRDFAAMRRVFAGMSPETEASMTRIPEFLALRANYRAATGSHELAYADYREALRIDPRNSSIRITLLFYLIDRRDIKRLRQEMAAAPEIQKDPTYDGVLGAAWLALDDPARAVEHYKRQVRRNPNDYLWLLNYADALEQNNEGSMAWRVRQHAWTQVRTEMQRQQPNPSLELLQNHARLAAQFAPGDSGVAVIRNLLRQDEAGTRADPRRRGLDAGTREIVLAWALSTEQHIAAKAWLWKQYARDLSKPTWAEVGIAVAENDVDALQRMLEERADSIPRYDRQEAARVTQQFRLAQDIAFTGLERHPYDDEMHLRVTSSVLDMVNTIEVGQMYFRRGTVGGRDRTGEVAVWLSPRLRLSFDVSYIDQGLLNASALAFVPGTDRMYGMTVLFRHAVGESRISVFHRDALSSTTGLRASYRQPLGPRVAGRIGFAYDDRALDTSGLAAGGVKDRAYVDAEYTFSKREYVLGELSASRYYTQERTFIGSGQTFSWETGHRFRTEYPDLHVRLAGSVNRFTHSGSGDASTAVLNPLGAIPTAAFFLPPSFSTYGVYTGFGTFYRTSYTRALRPFVDFGVTHNSVTGQGYSGLVGISGSLFGADRLTAYASTGKGGTGTNEVSREVGLQYMYMFDRF